MKDQSEFSKFCTLYMKMEEEKEDGEKMLEEHYDTKGTIINDKQLKCLNHILR